MVQWSVIVESRHFLLSLVFRPPAYPPTQADIAVVQLNTGKFNVIEPIIENRG